MHYTLRIVHYTSSQHLPYGGRTNRSEYLVKVRQHRIVCHTTVTEHGVIRLLLGDSRNDLIGDIVVKAGVKETVCNIEHLTAADGGLLDFGREKDAEVEHNLEQQIFRRSVLFDVACVIVEQGLLHLVRTVEYFFHVGGVAFQNTEANIKVLCCQRTVFFDFLAGTTDALLADFSDVFVACLIGFALFVGLFR